MYMMRQTKSIIYKTETLLTKTMKADLNLFIPIMERMSQAQFL